MPLSNVKNTLEIAAQNPITTLQIYGPFRQSSFTGLAEAQPLQRPSSDQEVSAFQSKLPEAFRTLDSELLWMLFVNASVKFASAFDEQAAFC